VELFLISFLDFVCQIARRHHPEREAELPALLRNYRGREAELLAKLIDKPSLLLRIKKSFEPRKNLAPLDEKVMTAVALRLGPGADPNAPPLPVDTQGDGAGLFSSIRGSIYGDGVGLSDMLRSSLAFNGSQADAQAEVNAAAAANPNPRDASSTRGRNAAPERVTVATAAKTLAASSSSSGAAGAAVAGSLGALAGGLSGVLAANEVPFVSLKPDEQLARLALRPPSAYAADPALNVEQLLSLGVSNGNAKDKAACLLELDPEVNNNLARRAQLLETMKLDDAVRVLVELRLRGDFSDTLGQMGRGAQVAVKNALDQHYEIAEAFPGGIDTVDHALDLGYQSGSSLSRNKATAATAAGAAAAEAVTVRIPPEAARLLTCGAPHHAARLLQGLPLQRAAFLLLEMHRRGAAGPVLDAMVPGGLAAVLAHVPPAHRAALLVTMTPKTCGAVVQAMAKPHQVKTLAQMSQDEVAVVLSVPGLFEDDEEADALLVACAAGRRKKNRRQSMLGGLAAQANGLAASVPGAAAVQGGLSAVKGLPGALAGNSNASLMSDSSSSSSSTVSLSSSGVLKEFAAKEARKAEKAAARGGQEGGKKNSGNGEADSAGEDSSSAEEEAYEQYFNAANEYFTSASAGVAAAAADASSQAARAANDAAGGVAGVAGVAADSAAGAAGSAADAAAAAAAEAESAAAATAAAATEAADDVDIAMPSWAALGQDQDRDDDKDDNHSVALSEATTELSGVSERGAGDGSVLEQMVWNYLMQGLPDSDQAQFNALDEQGKQAVLGRAADAAKANPAQYAAMTSGEAALKAQQTRERESAAAAAKANAEANASPWSVFSQGIDSALLRASGEFDRNLGSATARASAVDGGIIGNFLQKATAESAAAAGSPTTAASGEPGTAATNATARASFSGFPSWLAAPAGGSASAQDALGSLLSPSSTAALMLGATTRAAAAPAEPPQEELARHQKSMAKSRATKAAANLATKTLLDPTAEAEAFDAPAPLVPLPSLPGFVDVEAKASLLFSAQDAKLLSSKWGVSVTEIKFVATQIALLAPGDNGLLDPRLVPHILNRLGYFDTMDSAVLPREAMVRFVPSARARAAAARREKAELEEAALLAGLGKKPPKKKALNANARSAVAAAVPLDEQEVAPTFSHGAWAGVGGAAMQLTPVDVADCFGKAAFALAESARFENGPSSNASAGTLRRVALTDADAKGWTPTDVLCKDPLASLAAVPDSQLARYLFVFKEVAAQSDPDAAAAAAEARTMQAAAVAEEQPQARGERPSASRSRPSVAADTLMETRLLGRALRRAGFGRPTGPQAAAVLQWTGVRLALPADVASDAGEEFAHAAAVAQGGNSRIGAAAAAAAGKDAGVAEDNDDHALGSGVGAAAGSDGATTEFIGVFEFLCSVSVMMSPDVDPFATVDTSCLPNGHEDDASLDIPDLEAVLSRPGANFKTEEAALAAAAKRARGRAEAMAANVEEREVAEKAALEALVLAEPHGWSGGQALLLQRLFLCFAEDFEVHRRGSKVVQKGLRGLLRACGCFPSVRELRAIRDTYGDLALNLHLDQFARLARHLQHWFPAATPKRILGVASRQAVSLFDVAAAVSQGPGGASGLELAGSSPSAVAQRVATQAKLKGPFSGPQSRSSLAKVPGSVVVVGPRKGGNVGPLTSHHASSSATTGATHTKGSAPPSSDPTQNFAVAEVEKLEHAFGCYDYDQDGILDQTALRALLRRLHVNWSAKQFVRVTRGALGQTAPDYDIDDFVGLLALTSAHMVDTKEAKKEGQTGRRVANHHAKILYSHFAVVWNLPPHQLALIQRAFCDADEQNLGNQPPRGLRGNRTGGRALVPRSTVRGILATLGVNFARVEASGLSEAFDVNGGSSGNGSSSTSYHTDSSNGNGNNGDNARSGFMDFDELLGAIAHLVHLYGFVGNGVDDPLSYLTDGAVADARRIFFNQVSASAWEERIKSHWPVTTRLLVIVVHAPFFCSLAYSGYEVSFSRIETTSLFYLLLYSPLDVCVHQAMDPSSKKVAAKHCLLSLRQMGLVATDLELDRALRLSGVLPQYRNGWLGWPAFVRLIAQLNYQRLKDEKLHSAAHRASSSSSQFNNDDAGSNEATKKKLPVVEVMASLVGASVRAKSAADSDIEKLRGDLSSYVQDHHKFEHYMDRLNHTYKVLQAESSQVVPARPAEPDHAPLDKKTQRKLVSAVKVKANNTNRSSSFANASGSFGRRRGSGSFGGGSRDSGSLASRGGSREGSREGSRAGSEVGEDDGFSPITKHAPGANVSRISRMGFQDFDEIDGGSMDRGESETSNWAN